MAGGGGGGAVTELSTVTTNKLQDLSFSVEWERWFSTSGMLCPAGWYVVTVQCLRNDYPRWE